MEPIAFAPSSKSTTPRYRVPAVKPLHPAVTAFDGTGDTASATGPLELFSCAPETECTEQLPPSHAVDLLVVDGNVGQSPAPLDLAVAPFAIAGCESTIGPDVAVTDSMFTGDLSVTEIYHPYASSDPKVTCFESTVPFVDRSGGVVTAGPLPHCQAGSPKAPCVEAISVSGSGSSMEAKKLLLIPPGDPTVGAH